MTTINATILEDRIISASDTLITRAMSEKNSIKINNLVEKSKKIVIGNFKVKSKSEHEYIEHQSYSLLFGFAGSVTLNSNFKSRLNLNYSFGSINDHLKRKDLRMSLKEVVGIYKEVFEKIISNIIFNLNDPFNMDTRSFKDTTNTEILIMGFCQIEEKYKIYKLFNNSQFTLTIEEYTNKKEVVTIGCKSKEIKDIVSKSINIKDILPDSEINNFCTSVLNQITNKEYITIGGDLSVYTLSNIFGIEELFYERNNGFNIDFSNKLNELKKNHLISESIIIRSILSSYPSLGGINIKLNSGYLIPSFGITLNLNILNLENYLEHFKNSNKIAYDIYLFLKNNNLRLRKKEDFFELIDSSNKPVEDEDIIFDWKEISYYTDNKYYYYHLIKNLIENTDVFKETKGNIYYILKMF